MNVFFILIELKLYKYKYNFGSMFDPNVVGISQCTCTYQGLPIDIHLNFYL